MIHLLYSIDTLINDTILGAPRQWVTRILRGKMRYIIILIAVVFSGLWAFAVSGQPLLYLLPLILLVGIVTVFLLIKYPTWAIIVVIWSGLIPYNGRSGINATVLLVTLLLGVWILDMILRRDLRLVPSITIRPLFVFIAIVILAFAMGQVPWYVFAQSAPMATQLGSLTIFILSAGGFLLTAHQIRDIKSLERITWFFLVIVAIYIVGRLTPGINHIMGRVFNITNTGSLFWVWGMAFAVSQATFNRKLHWILRAALGVLTLGILYVGYVIQGDWKSGWVPAFVTLAAVFGFRYWKQALILSPFGAIPAWFIGNRLIASDAYSYSTRVEAWALILKITKINPILGLGPANYRWYTPLFPIRGYSVFYFSHNQYIDLFAQAGILGLGAFLWFFASVGWLGWQLKKRVPTGGFAEAYVYAALGGTIGTLASAAFGDWVIGFFYNVGFTGFRITILSWLFLGGLVALEQILNRTEAQQTEGVGAGQ